MSRRSRKQQEETHEEMSVTEAIAAAPPTETLPAEEPQQRALPASEAPTGQDWTHGDGPHDEAPLATLAALRSDPHFDDVHWSVRPKAVHTGPALRGMVVVPQVAGSVPDEDTWEWANQARRMIAYFAGTGVPSQVHTDATPGLSGRTRLTSEKTIRGITVEVAVTLPKDTPLDTQPAPTGEFPPVDDGGEVQDAAEAACEPEGAA